MTDYTDVDNLEVLLNRCVRCGQCRSVCPAFGVIRSESASPRGKVFLAHQLFNCRTPLTPEAEGLLSLCLGCRACSKECPAGIPVHEIVYWARSKLTTAIPAPVKKLLYSRIWASPSLLSGAASLVRLLQAGNLLAPALSGHLPHQLLQAVRLQKPARSLLSPVNQPKAQAVANVAYFIGCATNYIFPDVAVKAVTVLTTLGCRVTIPGGIACCGLPHLAAGLADPARILMERNHAALTQAGVEAVVTDCASCCSTLTEAMANSSVKVVDISQLILDLPVSLAPSGPVRPKTVTYHDPCHLTRALDIKTEPRRLLASIPGLTLAEMSGSTDCCGGGGTFMLRHQEISDTLLARKIAAVRETGADTVATGCPTCMLQLSRGDSSLSVVHPVQLLATCVSTTKSSV